MYNNNKLKNNNKKNNYVFSFSSKIFNARIKTYPLQLVKKYKSKVIPLAVTFTITYMYYVFNGETLFS